MFQFGWFPRLKKDATLGVRFPHSEIAGSKVACHLPDDIVDCNVLHRLKQPRHPLSALFKVAFRRFLSSDEIIYLLVKEQSGLRESRTPDLPRARRMLYQLSYEPKTKKTGLASFPKIHTRSFLRPPEIRLG